MVNRLRGACGFGSRVGLPSPLDTRRYRSRRALPLSPLDTRRYRSRRALPLSPLGTRRYRSPDETPPTEFAGVRR